MTTDDPKPSPRPPSRVVAEWLGDYRFDSGRPATAAARFDGDAKTGQSPPDALLSALATCSAIDLLDVLTKRRTPASALRVEVTGLRREKPPRRFTRIELDFHVEGATVERVHAERGLNLAFERYCTVAASLAPDIELWARVTLNGESGELHRQPAWSGD
jgi:putative redox protein